MKRYLSTAVLALTATMVVAAPAKRGLYKTVTLADGSQVKVELRGDEFCHYWQDESGRTFVRDRQTGLYKTVDVAELSAKAEVRRQAITVNRTEKLAARKAASKSASKASSLYTGTKKGLILLVQFADKSFADGDDLALYKRIANEVGFSDGNFKGSVKDYFLAQSYGAFELDFDVVGPITMPNAYAYYGGNDSNGDDNYQRVAEMVIAACKAADSEVDFSQYDWDGDGYADQVFVIYAGHGEASYDDDNTIWPHEWQLRYAGATYNSNGNITALGETPTLDGVVVNTYACSCELGKSESIDGIGIICHEFSHCLGLPDMYDTTYSGYFGMGRWSVMDQGQYNGNNNGFCPPSYTSYERMAVGWLDPTELTSYTEVASMKAIGDNAEAYIIYNDGNTNEYYLLENRQKTGWDAKVPSSGMLILHVDYKASVWKNNKVNSTSRQRCTIFPADNELVLGKNNKYADYTDTYPYGTNDSLTNTSTPAATLNNANTDGTYYMNKPVTEITQNDDGTMSFVFGEKDDSGIRGVAADATRKADNRIFSIDGRYVGRDIDALPKGIYIKNGKKILK